MVKPTARRIESPVTLAMFPGMRSGLDWVLVLFSLLLVVLWIAYVAESIKRWRAMGRIVPAIQRLEIPRLATPLVICWLFVAPGVFDGLPSSWGPSRLSAWLVPLGLVWCSRIIADVLRQRIFRRSRGANDLLCNACLYPQATTVATTRGNCPECGRTWIAGELPHRWSEVYAIYPTRPVLDSPGSSSRTRLLPRNDSASPRPETSIYHSASEQRCASDTNSDRQPQP